jgi:hypothetical protein
VARLELAVTIECFTDAAVPSFRVDSTVEAQWKTRGDRRGLSSLPVTFEGL